MEGKWLCNSNIVSQSLKQKVMSATFVFILTDNNATT